jgi:Cu/Zn superoxide dismutase
MKHTMLLSILGIAACGGKQAAPPKEPAPDPTPVVESKPAPEPAPAPPPPPPPRSWHAQAEMTPVAGVKIKAATVTFSQQEGQQVNVGSKGWFDGIKSGRYHFVVHEAAECGPNASKAGKPIATPDLLLVAAVGMDSVDVGKVDAIQLDGAATIVGHTLVLHDDKKGSPGKAIACGPITAGGD